jgi:hypothetical protein
MKLSLVHQVFAADPNRRFFLGNGMKKEKNASRLFRVFEHGRGKKEQPANNKCTFIAYLKSCKLRNTRGDAPS